MSRVIVCGSLNADLIVDVAQLPLPGQTVEGQGLRTLPGGKGANQAYAAAVASAPDGQAVVMIGWVGSDEFGEFLRSDLARAGVDVSNVGTAQRATGTALITVADGGENTIVVAAGANAEWPEDAGAVFAFAPADVVLLQNEIPAPAVRSVAGAAARAGARVILNAAPAHPDSRALADVVDVLIVNEVEATQILGLTDFSVPAVAAVRRELRCAVVVTCGERGVIVAEQGGLTRRLTAHSVEVIDTVGAGDAFAGVLAARLGAGEDIFEAARAGNAAAALTCTVTGARHPSLDYGALLAMGRN